MSTMKKADIAPIIRIASAVYYDTCNKASKHSDDELVTMYNYLTTTAGFKPPHAPELASFAPVAYSNAQPLDQVYIDARTRLRN
jgi:hypothetical protein